MPRILWPAPPDDLDLAGNQVHVFCAALDLPARQIAHLAETLSPDESERARRFRFERDAARFIASRGHLREILGRFLQSSPDRLALPPNPPLLPAFFDAWTRGEAFLKANGQGLDGLPHRVEISRLDSDWAIHQLAPAPDYIGATVLRNPSARVASWHWRCPASNGFPSFRVLPARTGDLLVQAAIGQLNF